jgi:hypothetical protein
MKLTLTITKGKPTAADLRRIMDMILQGYTVGIDQPRIGIAWETSKDTGMYNHLKEIVE